MFRVAILAVAIASCYAATTVMPMSTTMAAMQPEVLFDIQHHVAIIVRTTAGTSGNAGDGEGCYEYHMKNTEVQQVLDGMTDVVAMAAISALDNAVSVHTIGHNQINHLIIDIQQKCADLIVYGFH